MSFEDNCPVGCSTPPGAEQLLLSGSYTVGTVLQVSENPDRLLLRLLHAAAAAAPRGCHQDGPLAGNPDEYSQSVEHTIEVTIPLMTFLNLEVRGTAAALIRVGG
jgi:hypothetical protein